jgi:hypothetical protein
MPYQLGDIIAPVPKNTIEQSLRQKAATVAGVQQSTAVTGMLFRAPPSIECDIS